MTHTFSRIKWEGLTYDDVLLPPAFPGHCSTMCKPYCAYYYWRDGVEFYSEPSRLN